jgi:hypothetical protein
VIARRHAIWYDLDVVAAADCGQLRRYLFTGATPMSISLQPQQLIDSAMMDPAGVKG